MRRTSRSPGGKSERYRRLASVSSLTIPFIILISITNPILEETMESGYFFNYLQRHGMWLTVLAAAFFRGFLHTTMGVSGFVNMFAMGLLYGFFTGDASAMASHRRPFASDALFTCPSSSRGLIDSPGGSPSRFHTTLKHSRRGRLRPGARRIHC